MVLQESHQHSIEQFVELHLLVPIDYNPIRQKEMIIESFPRQIVLDLGRKLARMHLSLLHYSSAFVFQLKKKQEILLQKIYSLLDVFQL